jgi:hypothetical protein
MDEEFQPMKPPEGLVDNMMEVGINPDCTNMTVVPSESNEYGYVCALEIQNEFMGACLELTREQVESLIGLLSEYK